MEFSLDESPSAIIETKAAIKKGFQDVLLAEGLLAVKISVSCQTLEQLQQLLLKNLGQNSIEMRRR